MNPREHVALIGSGPSGLYLLKHLLDEVTLVKEHVKEISVFEKSRVMGMGMPYNPETTDRFNMSNISSEELPELPVTMVDWLRAQDPATLQALDVKKISESEVYSRLALGQYLRAQYQTIVARLVESGIVVREYPHCKVADLKDDPERGCVILTTAKGASHEFNRVIIATGHSWNEDDVPAAGYFASPWPISKLLPEEGEAHNFAIGTLGASLSAFDVISSLAHRHGTLSRQSGTLTFRAHPGMEDFKIVMHAGHGMLPHLQFDQENACREIYRHVSREELLALLDDKGFFRIDAFFDQVCRPALRTAFEKDGMDEMIELLSDPHFGLRDFVDKMSDEHNYANAFEGMRSEMGEAEDSVLNHRPVHWKEVIDDLMYTLNFHAELMPAEDHLLLQAKVMPFVMNVIAAMPLHSGDTILALYDAGKLDLVTGKVEVAEKSEQKGMTTIVVSNEGEESRMDYRMFIDCSGQKALELEDYPFQTLVKDGSVRSARMPFNRGRKPAGALLKDHQDRLVHEGKQWFYQVGGVDIDGVYRVVGTDGKFNPRIYDLAFPHTQGIRPYSYGLQACSDGSAILVKAWVQEMKSALPVADDSTEVTRIFEKV